MFRSPLTFRPRILPTRLKLCEGAGQWDLALDDADKCVKLRPTWPRGHACRGAALEGMGRLEEALAAFEAAQRISPSNPELVRLCCSFLLFAS